MSTELAVTAVTQTLRQLLDDEVAGKWGTDVLAGDLLKDRFITNLPPHRVREIHASDNVLNLFLYRTDVSAAWRNLSPPAQGKAGESAPPPLALHLEYLISAYGEDDREEVAHFFLGQAMRILHDIAIVPRQKLFDVLKKAHVHDQFERITVTPRALSIEEISKLWSVFQTQYRVSAAYVVTVVLIDSQAARRTPLPVLKRGADDRGPVAIASAAPVVDAVKPASGFGAVRLGEDLAVTGSRLDAGGIFAAVRHRFMKEPKALPVTVVDAQHLALTIPAAAAGSGVAAAWPAGIYSLWLEMPRQGLPKWTSRDHPVYFALAPTIAVTPNAVQPPVASFEVAMQTLPQVDPRQTVSVLFDDAPVAATPPAAPVNTDAPSVVKANLPGKAIGVHRIRLSVDGIDSIAAVKTGDAFDFDAGQSVEVKP